MDAQELEDAVKEIERVFKDNDLEMNKKKCEIFTDRRIKCVNNHYVFTDEIMDVHGKEYLTEIAGIKIVPYVKYLGVIIAVDRKAVLGAAKHKVLKYV